MTDCTQTAFNFPPVKRRRITKCLEDFRAGAAEQGTGYQTAINLALREYLSRRPVDEETLRRVLREELHVA